MELGDPEGVPLLGKLLELHKPVTMNCPEEGI